MPPGYACEGHGLHAQIEAPLLDLSITAEGRGSVSAELAADERLPVLAQQGVLGHIQIRKARFDVPHWSPLDFAIARLSFQATTIQAPFKTHLHCPRQQGKPPGVEAQGLDVQGRVIGAELVHLQTNALSAQTRWKHGAQPRQHQLRPVLRGPFHETLL